MADYGELSDRATNLVEHAKQQEHLVTDEETYKNFENAYLVYKDLHRFIVNNRREVLMMNRKKKHKRIGTTVFSIFTFILGCVLTNNNKEIVEAVIRFFHH